MIISVIIEARSASTRLPKKILQNAINKKSFLEYLVLRLKTLDFIDNIIVATTINKDDNEIVKISKKCKVKYYRGSEKNVLRRVINASKKFKTDLIIRVTSDCPVIDTDIIYQAYKLFENNDIDFVSNAHIRSYPVGMDVEIFKSKILYKSVKYAKAPSDKEHITLAIRNNPKIFKQLNLVAPKNLFMPKLGLTLDYKEDMILLRKIINKFKNKKYNCIDILNYLSKNKNLLKINNKVRRTKYSAV